MKKLEFEILVTDINGDVVIENEKNFNYSLLANNKLWKDAEIHRSIIIDKKTNINLAVTKLKTGEDVSEELKQTFSIKVKGDFKELELFRLPLLEYLKVLKFDSLYVLQDEVSMQIAQELYPGINKVESLLRKYIIKFLVTKLGPKWWDLTADVEMQKKTNFRKRNETVFSEFVDNRAYLIDFGELGKIIHSQSSGNLKKEDLLQKISSLEESPEAIAQFKKEIQSNYNKFFKKAFKENDFQKKWEELEKLRHKTAHNNLFTLQNLDSGKLLIKDLIEIIQNAEKSIEKISFSLYDKEAIMDSFVTFEDIDEETLLRELRKSQDWAYHNADDFVGIKSFVTNHLGSRGYKFETTWDLIHKLEEEGKIETYHYTSEKNEYGVSSVRIAKQNKTKPTLGDLMIDSK
ncbi:HEPN domain-containing protein [Maribacter dokdonensis]|uniref:HEPN domain-containing protein n=1 Tax=Maribacter dokdonensis TaxID=320912 RepID=UPI002AAF4ADA|nr:HEPN domain-containing protein [Maribacter dokdonensis]